MIVVISPSKTQDYSKDLTWKRQSTPIFLQEANYLAIELKSYSPKQLQSLMNISSKLADLNYERFQKFQKINQGERSRQAILAYRGDVYEGINVEHYSDDDISFAQDHLRIITGLYGILKPLDLIQPYRLEMGLKMKTGKGDNLYEYWGDKITESVNHELNASKDNILINLASKEYWSAINEKILDANVITPVFKEKRGGKYKVIALNAKRARGKMTDFIIKNKITNPEQIKGFSASGYVFNEGLSNEREWVFVRG